MKSKTRILIVGAGLTGLKLARDLAPHIENGDFSVTLIEKSRGLGGRLATKRFESQRFESQQPINLGVTTLDDFPAEILAEMGEAAQANPLQTSRLARALFENEPRSRDVQLLLQHRLVSLQLVSIQRESQAESGPCWITQFEGEISPGLRFDRVIFTCPIPQTLAILPESIVKAPEHRETVIALENIQYTKALVGLFPGAARARVEVDPSLSEAWFELDPQIALQKIWESSTQVGPMPESSLLHRWRYSRVVNARQENFIEVADSLQDSLASSPTRSIIVAGDAFAGGGISGAIESARAVTRRLLTQV